MKHKHQVALIGSVLSMSPGTLHYAAQRAGRDVILVDADRVVAPEAPHLSALDVERIRKAQEKRARKQRKRE